MIEIGGQTFPSIAEMRKYIHNLLTNAPLDEPLSDDDGKLIHELFLHHPQAEEKLGDLQPEYFKVGEHPQAGARAFCIVRTDGVEETFSMNKCVSAWRRVNDEKGNQSKSSEKKEPTQQKKSPKADEVVSQETYADGLSGLIQRFQRVILLYNELGKEIEQITKLLAEESKR